MDITFDEFLRNEELAVDVTKVDWGEIKKGKRRGATMNEKDDGVDDENEPELESTDSGKNFHDSDYDFREDEDDIIYKNCATTVDMAIDGQRSVDDASYGGENAILAGEEKKGSEQPQKAKAKAKGTLATNHDCDIYDGDQIPIQEEFDSINTEDFNSCSSSLDENTSRKKLKYVRFKLEIDIKDPKLFVGLLFDTKKVFKRAVEFYSVQWGKKHGWQNNDKNRIRAKCKKEKCNWFVYAAKELDCDAFVIRTMGPEHQCGRTFYHKHANSGFLARHYMEFLRTNRKVMVGAFKDKVHEELNVNITEDQAYKTFGNAKILI